jgi:hypothetical protein
MFKTKKKKGIESFNCIRLSFSKIYKKTYRLVFPYEKIKNKTYLHAFLDLITILLNPKEFDQYFNNQNFNS